MGKVSKAHDFSQCNKNLALRPYTFWGIIGVIPSLPTWTLSKALFGLVEIGGD
jgi:hypothetical protein